ncbi:MAG: hypothetical protein V8Q54_00950 [Alistipes senegalensis]
MDIAMLGKGYHVVYYDVTFLYGSPRSQRLGDEFYAAMLKYYELSPKVVVEGFSRADCLPCSGRFVIRGESPALTRRSGVRCDELAWPLP